MPDLPSNPTVLMRDLNRLNQWLTRIVGAYAFASDAQKEQIDVEIRALLLADEPDIRLVDWRGVDRGVIDPVAIGTRIFGLPCEYVFTSQLDDLIEQIETGLDHIPIP